MLETLLNAVGEGFGTFAADAGQACRLTFDDGMAVEVEQMDDVVMLHAAVAPLPALAHPRAALTRDVLTDAARAAASGDAVLTFDTEADALTVCAWSESQGLDTDGLRRLIQAVRRRASDWRAPVAAAPTGDPDLARSLIAGLADRFGQQAENGQWSVMFDGVAPLKATTDGGAVLLLLPLGKAPDFMLPRLAAGNFLSQDAGGGALCLLDDDEALLLRRFEAAAGPVALARTAERLVAAAESWRHRLSAAAPSAPPLASLTVDDVTQLLANRFIIRP